MQFIGAALGVAGQSEPPTETDGQLPTFEGVLPVKLSRVLKAAAFGAVLTLGVAAEAWAFGQFGHVTICEIAYRELEPTARAELVRLVEATGEYTSFNQACLFADRQPRTRPSEHFVNYSRDQAVVTGSGCGTTEKCVITAIASDLAILADRTADDAKRGRALILLGHWVGDIHQPLHVSYKDDRGGNNISKEGRCGARNLHAVWDNCIVEDRVLPGNRIVRALGWGKFTRAYRAADRLSGGIKDADRAAWLQTEPWEWAAESYEIATSPEVQYCTKRQGACWYAPTNKVLDDGEDERSVEVDDAYLDEFAPVVETRMRQAGVRLAALINKALSEQ
jgi:hypothetical protein